jgi:hypothetical protein
VSITIKDFADQAWGQGRAVEEIGTSLQYLKGYLGSWYKWGGESPMSGFDCSGLACEFLKSLGIMRRGADTTAQGIANFMPRHETPRKAFPGDLVFFGKTSKDITHVEICITRYLTIGASGGGSKTLTVADAIRDRAFIKVRPIIIGREKDLQFFSNTNAALSKVFETGQPLF